LAHDADPMIGKQLGQYKILGVLGRGGMGAVYRAEDVALARQVAIKVLPSELVQNNSERFQRFLREARSAGRLNHPNVVTIYQFGVHDGRYFIVMELVEGNTLVDILNHHGPIDVRRATNIVVQAARALGAAHLQGIIHRDIKPGNIMVTRGSGMVKVADFGLAKIASITGEITQAGDVVGTPLYMSPEQCRGDPADERSDIYSLCMTYYRLLTGQLPFEAESAHGTMYKQIHEPLPDPRKWMPDLAHPVVALLYRGLAKSPDERFQSAAELERTLLSIDFDAKEPAGGSLEELAGALRTKSHSAVSHRKLRVGNSASPTTANLKRLPGRSRVTLAIAAAVFAAVSFGLTWFVVGYVIQSDPKGGGPGNGGHVKDPKADRETEAREEFNRIRAMDPTMRVIDRINLYQTKVIEAYPNTVAWELATAQVQLLEQELRGQAERAADAESEYQSIIARLERDFPSLDARILRLQKFVGDPRYADTDAVAKAKRLLLDLRTQLDRVSPKQPAMLKAPPKVEEGWSVLFDGEKNGNVLYGGLVAANPKATPKTPRWVFQDKDLVIDSRASAVPGHVLKYDAPPKQDHVGGAEIQLRFQTDPKSGDSAVSDESRLEFHLTRHIEAGHAELMVVLEQERVRIYETLPPGKDGTAAGPKSLEVKLMDWPVGRPAEIRVNVTAGRVAVLLDGKETAAAALQPPSIVLERAFTVAVERAHLRIGRVAARWAPVPVRPPMPMPMPVPNPPSPKT